jgi:hypothetical protein
MQFSNEGDRFASLNMRLFIKIIFCIWEIIKSVSCIKSEEENMDRKPMTFESTYNIEKLSFDNVSKDFEKDFKKHYSIALNSMSDGRDKLTNASGANTLGILEKMGQRLNRYDRNSDFSDSYHQMEKEFEPFTES